MHLSLNNAVNLHLYRLQLLRPAFVSLFAGHSDKRETEQSKRARDRDTEREGRER